MPTPHPEPRIIRNFRAGLLRCEIYPDREAMGRAAAAAVAAALRSALAKKDIVRFIVATGTSQDAYVASLVRDHPLPWDRIECFHMDEYVGVSADHPASFRRYLRERIAEAVRPPPRAVHYVQGDAADVKAECARYAALLAAAPVDVVSLGIGENGHIAFNDPPVADFNDRAAVKVVALDEGCKRQQVGEGHFPNLDAVPKHAITLTIPTLMRVKALFAIVPDARKAEAVRNALEGPVATRCPASILRQHPSARLFLDVSAAGLLKPA